MNRTRYLVYFTYSWLVTGVVLGFSFRSEGGVPIEIISAYVLIGLALMITVRHTEKAIKCSRCHYELMPVIEESILNKSKECFCPKCGLRISNKANQERVVH